MNAISSTSTRRRMTAAALLIAAGAIAAGGLGAATANARPIVPTIPREPGAPVQVGPATTTQYAAVALSPETGVWATFVNAGSSSDANFGAVSACQNAGGSHCFTTDIAQSTQNKCTALAVHPTLFELWHAGQGPTVISSETAALQTTAHYRIAAVACSNGGATMSFTGHVNQLSGT